MAEPTSSGAVAAAGAVGLTATAIIPGVDVNAVIGGFAGALLFVLWAHDLTMARRLGYLLVSWVGGYYAGIEALGRGLTQTSGMAAFVAATLCVTGGIGMLEWMRGGELPSWMRGLLRRRGGKSDG
ncbi:TPA: phage holin family protein [Pseudomonas aeruginosa]